MFCRFGTIRNNTALKLSLFKTLFQKRFGTIRNNTALKRFLGFLTNPKRFGTIQNNTALKLHQAFNSVGQVLEPFETTQL